MRAHCYRISLGLCLWLSWSLPAPAETITTDRVESQTQESALSSREIARARQWGLKDTQWRRYQSLMKGPRGLWSPDLDPILVLGIHAETEAERRRYAELAVHQERRRVEGELAFQRAYAEAWQRLYPDAPLFDIDTARWSPDAGVDWQPGDRMLFFTASDCVSCQVLLPRLLSRVRAIPGVGLDIYLLDTQTDEEVRTWARTQGISPDLVQTRQVTLNHDHGALARLSYGAGNPPYLVLRRLDNRFEPLSTDTLGVRP